MEPEKLYRKKRPEEEYGNSYQSQDSSSSQYSGCSGSGCSSCNYSC